MSESEYVEWHTWSGRRHKFGPVLPALGRYDHAYRVAQCNRNVTAEDWFQQTQPETHLCKRCFPDGA